MKIQFSPMKSHCGTKLLLSVGYMPSHRWPTEHKLIGSLEVHCIRIPCHRYSFWKCFILLLIIFISCYIFLLLSFYPKCLLHTHVHAHALTHIHTHTQSVSSFNSLSLCFSLTSVCFIQMLDFVCSYYILYYVSILLFHRSLIIS